MQGGPPRDWALQAVWCASPWFDGLMLALVGALVLVREVVPEGVRTVLALVIGTLTLLRGLRKVTLFGPPSCSRPASLRP